MPLITMKACPTASTSPTNATAFDSGNGAENQELHREDRPKERDDLARREVPGESGSDRECHPQPDTALA
jgi:hypothetical protein